MVQTGGRSSPRDFSAEVPAPTPAPTPAASGLSVRPLDRPLSLTEATARQLREAIIDGDLPLGQPLSEHVLASRLNVSKTPVREALVQLRSEGLVTIVPHKGTFVFTLKKQEAAELCEHWATLAATALRLSCERDGAALTAALERIVAQMADAWARSDEREHLRLSAAFHEAFFTHCGNGYMTEGYRLIAAKIAAVRTHLSFSPARKQSLHEGHRRIVEAIKRDEPDEAVEILRAQIGSVREAYLRPFGSGGGGTRTRVPGAYGWAAVLSGAQDEQVLALLWDLSQGVPWI